MLEALLGGDVAWKQDPDFGYWIVDVDNPASAALLEKVPAAILEPRRFFADTGRMDAYEVWVKGMNEQRRAFLESFGVDAGIVTAVCG